MRGWCWVLVALLGCGGEDGGADGDAGGDVGVSAADGTAGPACPEAPPAGWSCFEAGEFVMGSPPSEPLRDADEVQHAVRFALPLLVKQTEVTQAEWRALMGGNPSWFSGARCESDCDSRPVERINFFDALAWCNAQSAADGLSPCYTLTDCSEAPGTGCEADQQSCNGGYRCASVTWIEGCEGYRLPTESEWEYAARAGETAARYGQGESSDIGWFSPRANARTHPVGGREPNAQGLSDVIGNVAEWNWDLYDVSYGIFRPERSVSEDPIGGEFGDTRVVRGCAYTSGSRFCRLGARESQFPAQHASTLGFRPVRSVR